MLTSSMQKDCVKPQFRLFINARILFHFFILQLLACPSWGQVLQKVNLTSSDYNLWSEAHLDKVSPDENWVSYKLMYHSGNDTLLIRNITNNRSFYFAGGDKSIFTTTNFFICQIGEKLHILNLENSKKTTISGVIKFFYCDITNHLLILYKSDEKQSILQIRSLVKGTVKEFQNTNDFLLSPDGNQLVFETSSNGLFDLNLVNLKKVNDMEKIISNSKDNFTSFTWQSKSLSLAFLKESISLYTNSLLYFTLKDKKLYRFNKNNHLNFPAQTSITKDPFYKILISDDQQRVFFSICKENDSIPLPKPESNPEIWNTNDKWIYPHSRNSGNFNNSPKIAVWLPKLNRFTTLSTEILPKVTLTGNLENAILFNPTEYEPQFHYEGPSDFYIMNLITFKKDIFLKKHSGHRYTVIPSPTGKMITYFKENNWWIYNINLKTHKNITLNSGIKFTSKNRTLVTESICGSPGWSTNDEEVLLYDQFDIWAFRTDGSSYKRLTRGRKANIIFRIAEDPNTIGLNSIYDGSKAKNFNLNTTLLLRAEGDDGKTGYFKWNSNSKLEKIFYGNSLVDQLNYGLKKQKYFFRQQKFDLSPQIMISKNNTEAIPFFKSNPQQEKFFWGYSKLIEYQNSKKQNIKAVLIYPANYDPKKKYPMIVNVYEIQSKELHVYSNPTWYNEGGFNPSIFATEGYFVLLPDIKLEKERPGISAADCVISATQKVIDSGLVELSQIGLMGHSFGGYETAFIVTQTKLFATAIASGAITDLNSFYFTVNQRSGKPDMWRFYDEQWNMGKTPFEAPQSYINNSPLPLAEQIYTPLLLWTGKEDKQVDIHQSLAFYLALRRLNKKSILLLYPKEGHVITNNYNQKDITEKTIQWFDYFLKDSHNIQWINQGMK